MLILHNSSIRMTVSDEKINKLLFNNVQQDREKKHSDTEQRGKKLIER